ncbi:MAG: CPBP family intramembrane metalloprotease [Lachnospiraceae bacterium]|nr:CPBP family intramembrane metalloprotease [Lachnospiraceae bacterium]
MSIKILRCIPIGAASSIILNRLILLSGLLELFPYYSLVAVPKLFSYGPLVAFFLYCVLTPLWEEAFFRLIIYGQLKKRLPLWASAAVSSALFALYHGNVPQAAYALPFGFIICHEYECFKSFLAPVLVHASANGAVLLMYYLQHASS